MCAESWSHLLCHFAARCRSTVTSPFLPALSSHHEPRPTSRLNHHFAIVHQACSRYQTFRRTSEGTPLFDTLHISGGLINLVIPRIFHRRAGVVQTTPTDRSSTRSSIGGLVRARAIDWPMLFIGIAMEVSRHQYDFSQPRCGCSKKYLNSELGLQPIFGTIVKPE